MKRRALFLAVLSLFLVFSLAAEGNADAGKKEKVVLKYAGYHSGEQEKFQALINDFEAKNPDIKIELEMYPWTEYWTKLEALAVGKKMPDIVGMHIWGFYTYAKNGFLLDLKKEMPDFIWSDHFPEATYKTFEYKNGYYGIPQDINGVALYYNKELFTKAGVAYPNKNWTWEDMVSAAKKLTDKDKKIYGFGARNHSSEGYEPHIFQNGGYIISPDKKSSGFNLPKTISAIQDWKDMIYKYQVSPTLAQFSDTDIITMFTSGRLAMAWFYFSRLSQFNSNEAISGKFDVAILPMGKEKRATEIGVNAFAVSSQTKHKSEALRFMRYLATTDAGNIHGNVGLGISAVKGTSESFISKYKQYNVQAFFDMLDYAVPTPGTLTKPQWAQIQQDVMAKILSNQISVEEGCMLISKSMNELLATE